MSYLHLPTRSQSQSLSISKHRSSGIIFAILIHVGLVIAIGSGLTVVNRFHEPPPVIVRNIEPPKIIPQMPTSIDPGVLSKTFSNTEAKQPTVDAAPDDIAGAEEGGRSIIAEIGNRGAQIIEAKADPLHPLTQPAYPPVSRRLGEQGTVELGLYILADGRIGEVRIEQSSGYARLDEAARQHALKSWRLLPQQIDGAATASWQRIAITFRLK